MGVTEVRNWWHLVVCARDEPCLEQAAGSEGLIHTPALEKWKSPQAERGQVLGTSVNLAYTSPSIKRGYQSSSA